MKKFVLFLLMLTTISMVEAQVNDANYVIDYSEALICGLDEESFAVVEADWYKDKPQISGILIENLLKKIDKYLPFRKSSENTIRIIVRKITDNGKFTCDVECVDAQGESLFKAENIRCSKGGTWGTKLHLMKEGAEKEGKNIASAIKPMIKEIIGK